MRIGNKVQVIGRHATLWKWFDAIGEIIEIRDDDLIKVQFEGIPDCFFNEAELAVVEENRDEEATNEAGGCYRFNA